jgi:hypothetical protein
MGSGVPVCVHFDPIGSYSFWTGFPRRSCCLYFLPRLPFFSCSLFVDFCLYFRLYFLVPDTNVYAHVKRHQVLILYTWSPNLGVRKLASAIHPSLEPADSFGICLLECESPHILPIFLLNLFVYCLFDFATTRCTVSLRYGLTNEVNRVHWGTACHCLFPLSSRG